MDAYFKKVNHIVLPFLVTALLTLVAYMAIRWLLDLRFGLVQLDEDLWDFWIPFALPWIIIMFRFRRRFHILEFKMDKDRAHWLMQMICAFTLAGSLIASQNYLKATAGGFKELDNVAQFDPKDHERSYRIKNYVVASWMGSSHGTAHTSGRHNDRLNMEVFVVAPMLNDSTLLQNETPKVWYATKFREQIGNNASEERKNIAWRSLWERAEREMGTHDFHDHDHLRRVPASEDRKAYLEAIAKRTINVSGEEVILTPIDEPYGSGANKALAWMLGILGIGCGILMIALVRPGLALSEYEYQQLPASTLRSKAELDNWHLWFIPKADRIATTILVDINLIVFVAMISNGVNLVSPRTPDLIMWGANSTAHILSGDYWRLVTCIFIHGGIMHLLMNMIGLVLAGLILESMIGSIYFSGIFFITGITASLSSLWWNEQVISVGASGAVFGLFGALCTVILVGRRSSYESNKGLLVFLIPYILLNLLFGLVIPGIDNAGHIGGLLSGGVLGSIIFFNRN